MEAIERFFEVPEITNPMLVVIVGCFGLASNILGLFLFHEHGHDHGHGHEHAEEDQHTHTHSHSIDAGPKLVASPVPVGGDGERQPLLMNGSTTPPMSPNLSAPLRPRSGSIDSISLFGHPIQNRAYVIAKAQDLAVSSSFRASSPPVSSASHRRSTSLSLHRANSSISTVPGSTSVEPPAEHSHIHEEDEDEDETAPTTPTATTHHIHARSHSHSLVRESSGHADVERGHSHSGGHHHGSMNMRALLLHVLGDALGNVGVISSGLIIWQTTWKYRYYSDPLISLFITIIIFSSALPLVKSASFILLQGVPENVNLEVLCGEIERVEGVVSVHELHVWQLSETKHIASVHIRIDQRADYMSAVHKIRRILHRYNIHNATIQPEFGDDTTNGQYSSNCMVACPPGKDCGADQKCCPTVPAISVVHHD